MKNIMPTGGEAIRIPLEAIKMPQEEVAEIKVMNILELKIRQNEKYTCDFFGTSVYRL